MNRAGEEHVAIDMVTRGRRADKGTGTHGRQREIERPDLMNPPTIDDRLTRFDNPMQTHAAHSFRIHFPDSWEGDIWSASELHWPEGERAICTRPKGYWKVGRLREDERSPLWPLPKMIIPPKDRKECTWYINWLDAQSDWVGLIPQEPPFPVGRRERRDIALLLIRPLDLDLDTLICACLESLESSLREGNFKTMATTFLPCLDGGDVAVSMTPTFWGELKVEMERATGRRTPPLPASVAPSVGRKRTSEEAPEGPLPPAGSSSGIGLRRLESGRSCRIRTLTNQVRPGSTRVGRSTADRGEMGPIPLTMRRLAQCHSII